MLMVAFFVWLGALGKILTMENLQKWFVIVVDRCCMFKKNGESVDRLLIHYEVDVSPMASIRLYCKYFDDNKLYLVALMYLLQV
jgi:hypothetical protein